MLVLTRKLSQRIKIGDDIWIQVIEIDRNKIRLGIECPKEIVIMREELITTATETKGGDSNG